MRGRGSEFKMQCFEIGFEVLGEFKGFEGGAVRALLLLLRMRGGDGSHAASSAILKMREG